MQENEGGDGGQIRTIVDINLGILNEVLSIFGSGTSNWGSKRGQRLDEDRDRDGEEKMSGVRGPLDGFFWRKGVTTSMRMSYAGEGYPLRLLL